MKWLISGLNVPDMSVYAHSFDEALEKARKADMAYDTGVVIDESKMQAFALENGHTLEVWKANRGLEDDYKVLFREDGRALFGYDYYTKAALQEEFGVTVTL